MVRHQHRDGAQSGAQTGSGLTVLLKTEGGIVKSEMVKLHKIYIMVS